LSRDGAAGWAVRVVWECEIRDERRLTEAIDRFVKSREDQINYQAQPVRIVLPGRAEFEMVISVPSAACAPSRRSMNRYALPFPRGGV